MTTKFFKTLFVTLLVSNLQLNAQSSEVRVQVSRTVDDIVYRNLKNIRNFALVGSDLGSYDVVCECEPESVLNLGNGKFELDFTSYKGAKVQLYFVTSNKGSLVDTIATKTLRILALPNNKVDAFNYWYKLDSPFIAPYRTVSASLLSKVELAVVKDAMTYLDFHSDLPEQLQLESFVITTKKKSGKVISVTIQGNRIDSSREALALLNSLKSGSEVTLCDFKCNWGGDLIQPVVIQIQ